MDAAAILRDQFSDLAARFTRAKSKADVDSAAALGGRLLKRATDAGIWRWPTESGDLSPQDWPSGSMTPTKAENEEWGHVWHAAVLMMPKWYPEFIPAFTFRPAANQPEGIWESSPSVREVAENSAAIARFISAGCSATQQAETDSLANDQGRKILLALSHHADGIPLAELPWELLDPDSLMVADADELIEFGRRRHCHVGGKLQLENGWDFDHIARKRGYKPFTAILQDVLSDEVEHPDLRLRVRLTAKGEVAAGRLRLAEASNAAQRHGETKTTKLTRRRPATVNERMAGTIIENHEATGWNCTQWAKHLKCGRSTVVETPTWQALESARLKAKTERMKDRRRKPKASDSRRD